MLLNNKLTFLGIFLLSCCFKILLYAYIFFQRTTFVATERTGRRKFTRFRKMAPFTKTSKFLKFLFKEKLRNKYKILL